MWPIANSPAGLSFRLAIFTLATLPAVRSRRPRRRPLARLAGEYHRRLPLAPSRARGATMVDSLPPGPRMASVLQTIGWWSRPTAFLERCRARYGKRFTIRLLSAPPFVMLTDPDELKELFTAPPDVLHPGEGASILEPVVGKHSVILLDGHDHLEQRRLMLPAFHGEQMERLTSVMTEVADREAAAWPRAEPVA